MRLFIMISLLLSTQVGLYGQTDTSDFLIGIIVTEKMPEPRGGYDNLFKWIEENNQWKQGELTTIGKVYVQFWIDTTGNAVDIEVVNGLTEETDKEAIRLIDKMPNWIPAEQGSNKIKVKMVLPITFGKL